MIKNQETEQLDWLAEKALKSLSQFTDMPDSWIADKRYKFRDMDRLDVLRSFTSFDSKNLEVICAGLEVSVSDMQAVFRVLQKI